MDKAYAEIIALAEKGATREEFEEEKARISGAYGLSNIVKNADVILYMNRTGMEKKSVRDFLQTKPVRTLSGVANIAVMWLGENDYSCPFSCIFCPQGSTKHRHVPKSYTGTEPTTMRAMRNDYSPFRQVINRLAQLRATGHDTDKCELIVMGGTFMSWQKEKRNSFIRGCLDAFNAAPSTALDEAKTVNETAKNRVIGLTIETRADYCSDAQIQEMLCYGTTRVEIGVQTTREDIQQKINRGHGCGKNKAAFRALREAGLKITAHWMPGLTGLYGKIDFAKEVESFRELFENPDYRPDELKIYPTLVIPGTVLHDQWKRGEYEALSDEKMTELLIEMKKHVPPYVRIKRIMRDISEHEAAAGARKTNLRQLAKARGFVCRCIRCREVGLKKAAPENVALLENEYEASGGKEFFLSFEDAKQGVLVGFLRLRIDASPWAKVRELHVYGQQAAIGTEGAWQHRGFGRRLLCRAEEIAAERGKKKILVTSGIGAREYYRKLGYVLEGNYMSKPL
ncbi:MAG: tRNA uridine(34) 5-carboxymethylaminomethyl modification radical SAM/GNAT enzyme Elp3 [Candidatus Aenigmarchaeota archaeon]|nr:tRNA uridine(34) 5-carboxymethylaminomethyl modification radical SAM/GNAT enzyme Elp3 [Candidatus Aenigmarchaeota archaeon]